MKKELPDKNENMLIHMLHVMKWSFEGLYHSMIEERSCRLWLIVFAIIVIIGIRLHLSLKHWMIILFLEAMVLIVELLNTAIENVVDLVTKEYHPLAKRAKDTASAATFITALSSIMIAIYIFMLYF